MTAGWRHRRHFMPALGRVTAAEMTGRISMTSASARRASLGTRVSPWITRTDSGLISSRASSLATVIGPGTSSSRRGLRSRTFIGPGYRPRRIPRISKTSPGLTSNCSRVRCRFDITRRTTRSVVVAIVR